MDLKNQYRYLAGLDFDVRPSAQFKPTKTEDVVVTAAPVTTDNTLAMLADALEIVLERLEEKRNPTIQESVQLNEVVDPDVSLVYRVSGASQPAHAYWSQVSRTAGFGLKNKKTGDMLPVPYGMAFESRKEAKDYLKQTVSKDERDQWNVIDWAMECVAFGTSVEGYKLKHKESGEHVGPRFATPEGAEEYMNQKLSPEEKKKFEISPIQLTKESVGLGMHGYVIQNKKTKAIKSGPYGTREEAEEYLKRGTDGVEDPPFVVAKYEDVLGHSNFPNASDGVSESVILDESRSRRDKAPEQAGAKALNDVLKTKKGGSHASEKDYNRNKEKAKFRKEMTEGMSIEAYKAAKAELKDKGYKQTHSVVADDKKAGGVYFMHPESKKKAVVRDGKVHYDINEEYDLTLQENEKFLLQKNTIVNQTGTAGVKAGDNSSKRDGPAYRTPQYKHPEYQTTSISGEHSKLGGEEEEGVDVPQQWGSTNVPKEVLDSVRASIAYCREIAEKTPEDVINTKGHSDKSWWKNTADMLQQVLEWLESGDEANLKRAVVKMQSWENARWWSWPSELVKFMAHYGYGYKYPRLVDKFKEVKANIAPLK